MLRAFGNLSLNRVFHSFIQPDGGDGVGAECHNTPHLKMQNNSFKILQIRYYFSCNEIELVRVFELILELVN